MNDVTAIIVSFLRPEYTVACVKSLRETYPGIRIVVGENGYPDRGLAAACARAGARYVRLPFDCGVTGARNRLVSLVETPYVMVGDDDFLYDHGALADHMRVFLADHSDYDLIGGRVSVDGRVQNYQGRVTRHPDHFTTEPIDPEKESFEISHFFGPEDHPRVRPFRYCDADLTFNYFIARTEKVRSVPWDEEIKVAYEHFSWFHDFRSAGHRVAFSPEPVVIHKPKSVRVRLHDTPQHAEYMRYRGRKSDKERFFGKYGITHAIGMNGRRTDAPQAAGRIDCRGIDFVVTTLKRPQSLTRLLLSIARHAPDANVTVADQNGTGDRAFYRDLRKKLADAGMRRKVCVDFLPFDCGVSHARNHLVGRATRPYVLILDDDMEFTAKTDVSGMRRLLESNPRAGVVGGMVTQNGHEIHFEFDLERSGDTLRQVEDGNQWERSGGIRYRRTGCVLNFALFRRDALALMRWDPALKVSEHTDFYLRWKSQSPYEILYCPEVSIDHPPHEREPGYREMRQRSEFLAMMMRKHGITRYKYLNGQVKELLPDGSMKSYREKP